jgi:hypothetical protein
MMRNITENTMKTSFCMVIVLALQFISYTRWDPHTHQNFSSYECLHSNGLCGLKHILRLI